MKYAMLLLLIVMYACAKKAEAPTPSDTVDSVAAMVDEPTAVEAAPPPAPPPSEPTRARRRAAVRPPMAAGEAPAPTMAAPPAGANGGPPLTPPATDTDADEVSEVDAILGRLKSGGVLFDSPDTMTYRKSVVIKVALYPDASDMPSPTTTQDTGTALVSSRMEAHLVGEGFDIEALSPEVQAISSRVPTEWRWQVTPVQKGTLLLHLSLHARITVEGKETPYILQTFERDIAVKVTLGQVVSNFFGENWKWMWTAIFIPVFAILWKKFIQSLGKKKE